MNQRISYAAPALTPLGATAALLATAVCFGLVPLFARGLQEVGAASATIAFCRYGLSAVVLLPFLPRQRSKRGEALLLGGAGLLMGLSWIGYLESIKVVSVAAAGIVYMSYPFFTLLFAWLLIGQRPTARAALAVLLILCAASLVLSPGSISQATTAALLWALPAPAAFGLCIVVLCACLHRLSTLERMACAMLGASLGLFPMVLNAGAVPHALLSEWGLIAGIALFTAFLPQLVYTFAAPSVGPARSAATGSFELPTMILVGWLAFGESIGWREMCAAALVVAAVFITPAIRARRHR